MYVGARVVGAVALFDVEDADSAPFLGVRLGADPRSTSLAYATCCPVGAGLRGVSLNGDLMLRSERLKLGARRAWWAFSLALVVLA